MALNYKTPGVYLEEIPKLPPSVASVETAIPCFFGVTEKAKKLTDNDLIGESQKIHSLAEYELYFGMADNANAEVLIKQSLPAQAKLSSPYVNYLYYALKHYFDNGGGPCYIHSVGLYIRQNVTVDSYKDALLKLDLIDEVTLVVLPDLAGLNNKNQFYDVYNSALQKVSMLQDKFVIIDVNIENTANRIDVIKSANELRNSISNNPSAIKYGAAYFPNLETTYTFDFNSSNIQITFESEIIASNESSNLLNNLNYKVAKQMFDVHATLLFFNDDYFKKIATENYNNKIIEINNKLNIILSYFSTTEIKDAEDKAKIVTDQIKIQAEAAKTANETNFDFAETEANELQEFLDALRNKTISIFNSLDDAIKTDLTTNKAVNSSSFSSLNTTFLSKITPFFNSMFEARLKEAFLSIAVILPPSPAMAGVYATVDRTRGVWKAPANVSLNAVKKPEVPLSDADQQGFNIDAENGKSINCIRQFVGRGNLVWGARTLLGNDNEWRYINVRRFFNMVEESCENAARNFVFEPNDANTWIKVKGMIQNYLTNLWRDGALQGGKPEHAFYTSVGLNQTMTAEDILNGLMIVEIGLAVVRPAEFIVLRFSHKMAVS